VFLVDRDEFGAEAETDDRHVEFLVGHACCLARGAEQLLVREKIVQDKITVSTEPASRNCLSEPRP
jgi:hypothetical protein